MEVTAGAIEPEGLGGDAFGMELPVRELSEISKDGLDDLFREQYDHLVRMAFLLVDSKQEAEETVQDAFAKLQVRITSVRQPAGYLRRTVVNGCYDTLRKRRRERGHASAGTRTEPVEREGDYLLDVLATLAPKQRTAIVLRYYAGFNESEIAEAMRCPRGTVKTNLRRGLAKLREQIDE